MSDHKDIILPEISIKDFGSLHPINHMKDSIMESFSSFGFEIIDGPEIETEEFNFDMLNIKESHPASQMHDTFYVNNKSNVLRTHTSPVQIRGMLEKKPPLHLFLVAKFTEKMMMQLIYQCFIKLKVYMLMKSYFCST
jgi:phenylalanyl-tRNA synthetase alpha chain